MNFKTYLVTLFLSVAQTNLGASYIDYDLMGVWANWRHERSFTFMGDSYEMGNLAYCATYGRAEYDSKNNKLTLHYDGCKNATEDMREYHGSAEFSVKILMTPGYVRYIILYDKKSGQKIYGPLYFRGEK